MKKRKLRFRSKGCLIVPLVLLAAFVALFLSISAFPGFGAHGAIFLRNIIGDNATSQLEMFMFSVQDSVHQVEYNLGLAKANAPWQVASATPEDLPLPTPSATPVPKTPIPTTLAFTPTLAATLTPVPPTLTPTATPWKLAPIPALGSLEGEGAWEAYIKDASGHTLAYRTFLQPDPKRPYTLVAIVAFDLTHTRLGFVLGIDEPKVKGMVVAPRPGTIPPEDFKPGVLVATFNGGFMGEHGAYGAMSHGVVALPPRPGLATVTWRSGIAISPDGNTLFYIAGPSLTASVLANVMMSIGVQAGMQLDINNYWVHFVAVRPDGGKMVADPLYPVDMRADVDRYLKPYSRDFFYIAARTP